MIRQLLTALFILLMFQSVQAQVGLFEKPEAVQKKEKREQKYENRRDEKGRRQGNWMRYHPNGNPAYKARFVDDQPVDTLTRFYKNGNKYVEIVFDENTNRGKGKFYSEGGNLLGEGFYLNMQKDSVWHFYDMEGNLKAKEEFQFDEKAGRSEIYFDSGEIAAEVTYQKGEKQGEEKRYYPDGTLRVSVNYDNGNIDGSYDVYFENGQKEIEGFYKDNLRDSTWVFYDSLGRKKFTLIYENGILQNEDLLTEQEMEEFQRYEENRQKLKDPENFIGNPEEYMR